MKVVYVAGPFRGATPWDVAENVRAAERVALEVAKCGAMPLCPHTNTAHFGGQLTGQFWIDGTMELLKRSDAIIMVNGWEESSGSQDERAWALSVSLPVFYQSGGYAYLKKWIG